MSTLDSMLKFYTVDDKYVPIPSEMLEPFAGALIGRWFHRCETARKVKEHIDQKCKDENREPTFHEHLDSEQFYRKCSDLWWGLKALNKVGIACQDAVHFNLAIGNEMSKVSDYIEKYFGFNPILEKDPKKGFGF